jgi:shikimate dehydrogenase
MTDRYAVIGNPITHSNSPQIHKMFAEQTGQDISYEAILAPLDGFPAKVDELRTKGYKGCNVTVPFKLHAYNYVGQNITTRGLEAIAVNTIKFDGEITLGDNTDGAGLILDIEHDLRLSLQGKRVLLMGTGGAARGVLVPLVLARIQRVVIACRSLKRAEEMLPHGSQFLEDKFGTKIAINNYTDLGNEQFDVVINATSSGLSDDMPPLPLNIFAPSALAYDMMYGRETPFMKFARTYGAAVVSDGLGMLVEQAAESFFIWRGVHPETAPVIAALRQQQ